MQFARHLGAHVTGTASAKHHDWLRRLGADALVDYTSVAFEDVVADMDVVVDMVGDAHDTALRSLRVLRPGGLLVVIPSGANPDLAATARAAGVRHSSFIVEPDGHALTRIASLVDAGRTRGKLVLRVAPGAQ